MASARVSGLGEIDSSPILEHFPNHEPQVNGEQGDQDTAEMDLGPGYIFVGYLDGCDCCCERREERHAAGGESAGVSEEHGERLRLAELTRRVLARLSFVVEGK